MKKLICTLLCLSLLFTAATAEGLGGLSGGLDGLIEAMPEEEAAPLPDPADLLGSAGSLLQSNYQFTLDYLCNAYLYPMPDDLDAFVSDYAALAEQSGFTVSETTADGAPAYRLEQNSSGLYALLIPDVQGKLLLLVDVGLPFGESQGAAAPEPVEEEEEYVRFDINGREIYIISRNPYNTSINSIMYDKPTFEMEYRDDRSIISRFQLSLPLYAQAGDVFRVTKNERVRNLQLLLQNASEREAKFWVFHTVNSDDYLQGDDDYFTVTVESMEEDDENIDMILSFEGVFNKGADKIENGKMHAIIEK